jgi:hypothetical protein
MPFINVSNNISGMLLLSERGWSGKGAFEINGWVKDASGVERY